MWPVGSLDTRGDIAGVQRVSFDAMVWWLYMRSVLNDSWPWEDCGAWVQW